MYKVCAKEKGEELLAVHQRKRVSEHSNKVLVDITWLTRVS